MNLVVFVVVVALNVCHVKVDGIGPEWIRFFFWLLLEKGLSRISSHIWNKFTQIFFSILFWFWWWWWWWWFQIWTPVFTVFRVNHLMCVNILFCFLFFGQTKQNKMMRYGQPIKFYWQTNCRQWSEPDASQTKIK